VGGLRNIQVDVRVIAASNRDLERAVREGHFRQDLYYRLAVISIFLPPLRERKEDIPALVDFFLAHYNRKFRKCVQGMTEKTHQLLKEYDWPGNVRELKNALERAMILEDGPLLKPDDLPFSVGRGRSGTSPSGPTEMETRASLDAEPLAGTRKRSLPPLSIPEGGTSLQDVEHALVEMALRQTRGNQIKAAMLLNISRDALRYKMKKFELAQGEKEQPARP
jgi:DNA-binding NtrC family response regulator